MIQTIGQRLDHPSDFFHWIDHAVYSLAVLKAVVETDLCGPLSESPMAIGDLAAHSGLPADKVRRLIYFLAAEEVVALSPDGRVLATPRSRRLREVASIITIASRTGEIGPRLRHACVTGVSAYETHFGKPVFDHLAEQPELAASFAEFMGFLSRRIEQYVFAHHEFRPFQCAVDVGGSHGGLLLGLLARHPQARGVLFDLPETVAQVAGAICAAEHGHRVQMVGGDFFQSVPAADLYLLKMILHDWNDTECVAILQRLRASIPADGRIAVIEYLLPEAPAPTGAHVMDIAMLVWASGRERKLSEFQALFAAAGFRFDRVTDNPNGQCVIEAIPV